MSGSGQNGSYPIMSPNRARQDNAMRKLPSDLLPARMFIDDQDACSANEVAINWNAPLVFLLAGALPVK